MFQLKVHYKIEQSATVVLKQRGINQSISMFRSILPPSAPTSPLPSIILYKSPLIRPIFIYHHPLITFLSILQFAGSFLVKPVFSFSLTLNVTTKLILCEMLVNNTNVKNVKIYFKMLNNTIINNF